MATVKIRGGVVGKKHFPAKGDRGPQFLVNVQDQGSGQRFGAFVEETHPLGKVEVGEIVACTGDLSVNKSGNYFNLNLSDVVDVRRFKLQEIK